MNGRKVHFVGVGGVGMAGLAFLMKSRGFEVSGCDLSLSPRTCWLEANGVPVAVGHDAAHLDGVDEIVITPAVPSASAEYVRARELARSGRVKLSRRGEALAAIVNAHPDAIAVCGSHGKTTTATWTVRLLRALGEDVSWCIGGETGDFPVAGVGKGPLVVEADESDGTLALYRAKTLVVTNCEYDHPDFFPTPADYAACYAAAERSAGEVIRGDALAERADVPLPEYLAAHNRRNARAAVEVALRRGHSPSAIAAALSDAVSVRPDRRFQRVAEGVYTDYGHHPTEIACALDEARRICRGTLRVLFQPHRHSRTKALLADFPAAFALADEVVVCPVYAAFEPPSEGGDEADLYKAVREAHPSKRVFLARTCDEAWEHARNVSVPGDVTLILGAGDIIRLAGAAAAANPPRKRRRIFIGQGTNTWRSDLELDVDYVRTDGPAGRPGAELLRERPGLCPWMAGIPGTVGGWVRMNAGAFGHSISEVVEAVLVDDVWIPASECGFGYRTSSIVGEIRDVRWREADPEAGTPESYLARRRRFPAGTKGSVFKNPPGGFAGRLLEEAGAKELRVGGARVWEEHANVIVSGEGANASDFLALVRLMRNRVFFRLGVRLESEVRGV